MQIQAKYDNEFSIIRHFGDSQCNVKIGRNNESQLFLLNFFENIDEQALTQVRETLEMDHPSFLKLKDIRLNRTYQKRNKLETLSCLIYEFPQAGELYEYLIQTGRFNEIQARCYFKQIVEGLIHIHKIGKFHGELLTENIFFADAKTIKIGEYGRSFIQKRRYQFESQQWTQENNNNEQSKDIFALGRILFIMMFGRPPFSSTSQNDPFYKQFTDNSESFWQFWLKQAQVSQIDEFKDLIHGMLAFNSETRYSLSEIYFHYWTQLPCEIDKQMVCNFNLKKMVIEEYLRKRDLQNQNNQLQQNYNQNLKQKGVGIFRSPNENGNEDLSIKSNRAMRKLDKNLFKLDYHIILSSNPDQVYSLLEISIKELQKFSIFNQSEQFYKLTIMNEEESLIQIELFEVEPEIIIISFKRVKGELFTYIDNIKELHSIIKFKFQDENIGQKVEKID